MADFGIENLDPVVRAVDAIIAPVLDDLGYELVEVQFKPEQYGQILRIIIYKDSGIGVDDCAKVSREISHLLEVEDPVNQAYTLEVTSPGLDWRLRSERDFARFKGQKVRIVFLDRSEPLVGVIGEIDGDKVSVEFDGTKKIVSFDLIKKAKLVIEF